MVLATGSAPASPWFIAGVLLLIVLFLGTWSVVWLRSDRRRSARSGRDAPPPWHTNSVCVRVSVVLGGRSAIDVARTVIRNLGATDVRVIGDAVVGWIGKEWLFRVALQSAKQGYEVGIATRAAPDGLTEFLCCARPQLAMAVVGARRMNELATMLASEIAALTDGTFPPP